MVLAEKFPSRIQPWLLNALEQVLLRGVSPWVVSSSQGDPSYPRKVDDLGLLPRTLCLELSRASSVLRAVAEVVSPISELGRHRRQGIRRLRDAGTLFHGSLHELGNRVIMTAAAGLPDVALVHSHAMVTAYQYLEVVRALGVPLVHTFHGLHPKGVKGLPAPKRAKLFEQVAVCLVNTQFAKRQLESLGCPSEKIRILPQGIVLSEFPFVPQPRGEDEALRLLTVGRLHPDKGHRYAIEAVRLLALRGIHAEYRIIGAGPVRDSLEEFARDSSVDDRVTFVGAIDDRTLLDEYANAHVFILPSVRDRTGYHEETQGVVMQEAQCSGKIVVATRTGGIPECVDDGVSAFLVEDRSAEALADRLAHIATHPEDWERWQRLGREWVERHFDMHRIGQRLWDIYLELIDTEHSPGDVIP
jgi:glycosyltransferase involved in cell wall biosynthesis